jgi:hypothetical protein
MDEKKLKDGIDRLKNMIKPNGVIDIEYTLKHIEDNEYYMSVTYIVPDGSPYLNNLSRVESNMFRVDLNNELKRNILSYINVKVIITSSSIAAESYHKGREGHSQRQNEAIEKLKGLLL